MLYGQYIVNITYDLNIESLIQYDRNMMELQLSGIPMN